MQPVSAPEFTAILLYDGVCGLCNRLVQFLLKRDKYDRIRYASLQSSFATRLLKHHGIDAADLDTVYVVQNYDTPAENVLARSDAIIFLWTQLPGVWKWLRIGKALPRFFRDAIYRLVARNRYQVFGKYESCMLPDPKDRGKFLDV